MAGTPGNHSAEARLKHQHALRLIQKCKLAAAEQKLHQAILADNQFGPAHNNLGQLYFRRGRYYQAALEFEAAAGLMPDRAEPLNNLGLVFEAARRFPDAISQFQMAHEIAPTEPVYLGNLIRAMLRDEEPDHEAIAYLLDELLLIESRPDWREWALEQQATIPRGGVEELDAEVLPAP